MTPITREEIDELERKTKEATEGPWFVNDSDRRPDVFQNPQTGDLEFDDPENTFAWGLLVQDPEDGYTIIHGENYHSVDQIKKDLDFIAAARNALPRLIARVRELEAERFRPLGDNHHNAAMCPHCGDLLGKAKAENAKLREAIQDAGWSVMQTSGKWSIHCVTEKAKQAEEVEARVIGENIQLEQRVRGLEAALKSFADYVDCRHAAAVLAKGEAS